MAERQNTKNPIPSNALADLNDNTIIIDEWTNSKGDYTEDRFGVQFKTRYKILYDLQTAVNNIHKGSFLPLTGGTLSGDLTIQKNDARILLRSGNVGTTFRSESSGVFSISYFDGSSASVKAYYTPISNSLNFVNLSNVTINDTPVLKVGDYGLGGTRAVITNYDTVYANGFYYSSTGALGDKPFNYSYVISNVISLGSAGKQGAILAFGVGDNIGQVKFKSYQQKNDSGWVDLVTSSNIANYSLSEEEFIYINGTKSNPLEINLNSTYSMTDPYPEKAIKYVAQIYIQGTDGVSRWIDVFYNYENNNSFGVNVFIADGKIVIYTGITFLVSRTISQCGLPAPYAPSANMKTGKIRLRVIK